MHLTNQKHDVKINAVSHKLQVIVRPRNDATHPCQEGS